MSEVIKVKFGHVKGGTQGFSLPMGASEVLKSQSGRFVKPDGTNRRGEIAGDGNTELMGWVEGGDETCSSTEGGTVKHCIHDLTAIFCLPFIYDGSTYTRNYSDALLSETCDLYTASNVQYANLTDSDEDTLVIVGGQAATATASGLNDGYVLVKLNPNKLFSVGVAD